MEGRTIVRPDVGVTVTRRKILTLQWRAGQSSGQTTKSNGGYPRCQQPSMEGRTIVRPDPNPPTRRPASPLPFNGGPDNRPARRLFVRVCCPVPIIPSMEGRTIVRPDQADGGAMVTVSEPSMEGRTIVRPDRVGVLRPVRALPPFNGGPDNRPARPFGPPHVASPRATFNGGPDNRPARLLESSEMVGLTRSLQWRAGQSSGQTW